MKGTLGLKSIEGVPTTVKMDMSLCDLGFKDFDKVSEDFLGLPSTKKYWEHYAFEKESQVC